MAMTMRVSLPGINALTNGTVDQYALYADQDNILIKEFVRGTMNVTDPGSGTVSHNLGYVPLYFVYCQVGAGRFRIANSFDPLGSGWRALTGTANLVVTNIAGGGTAVQYYVFYDNLT